MIKYIDERNEDGGIIRFFGININKEFMPTVANINNVDATKYKVVKRNRFVFSGMQTGRDRTIRVALFSEDEPIIVSPAYTTFEIKDEKFLMPEYLFMLFSRDESDRYGWFISDSSVRANLDLDRFEEITFIIPPIKIQKSIVGIYNAYITRMEINEKLKKQIKDICPVLIKGSLEEVAKSEKV